MNEDVLNASIRKFLKKLGCQRATGDREGGAAALAEGKLKGNEQFAAMAMVTLAGIGLSHEIEGEIELE